MARWKGADWNGKEPIVRPEDLAWQNIREFVVSRPSLVREDEVLLLRVIFGNRCYNCTGDELEKMAEATKNFCRKFTWRRLKWLSCLIAYGVSEYLRQEASHCDPNSIADMCGAVRHLQASVFKMVADCTSEEEFWRAIDDEVSFNKILFRRIR